MPGLPSGTVTFLFTDIEGSTERWERDREQTRQALVEQLGADTFRHAWEAGRGLSPEHATTAALALADELGAHIGR